MRDVERQCSVRAKKNQQVAIDKRSEPEPVERFRDVRDLLRRRLDFEVTNGDALSVILDVYSLHAEREGLDDLAIAAGQARVAADGGEVQ